MNKHRVLSIGIVGLLATAAFAGSLNPPAPPTAGTMKPLDQVEPRTPITGSPFIISASGSYYLTKNLTSVDTAIIISADDVTLDLCGFTLTGPGSASGGNHGIDTMGRKNIEIRNGTIKSFGHSGIFDNSMSAGRNHRIINVRLIGNGGYGIWLANGTNLVKDCFVFGNGKSFADKACGIYVLDSSTITGCTVFENGIKATGGASGIYVGSHCTISGNAVSSNGDSSPGVAVGIETGTGCTISGNKVFSNGSFSTSDVYGIRASSGCAVSGNTILYSGGLSTGPVYGVSLSDHCSMINNTVRDNYGTGITASGFCHIIDNIAMGNSNTGISGGDNSTIRRNTVGTNSVGIRAGHNSAVSENTVTSNASDGIVAGDRVTITGNTVTSNAGSGISCTGGTVAQNTVSLNNTSAAAGKGGIVVSYRSRINENTLEGNSKNNIYVTGFRNCVEGNVMSGSDYGINFGSTGNLYLNNRATCNGTNYNSAGNTDGGGNISF